MREDLADARGLGDDVVGEKNVRLINHGAQLKQDRQNY
jgi:hypothetical protein